MGSAIGAVLLAVGYRVVTTLAERSPGSRHLAQAAGFEDLATLEQVISESDILLAILPPASARSFACQAAAIIESQGNRLVYADCNAVSPGTLTRIASLFAAGPAEFIDIGIVGPPPRDPAAPATRFYVAGRNRHRLLAMAVPGIQMVDMGDSPGRASAIKMCYAAMNKGVDALFANLLLASRRLGVETELIAEFGMSQTESLRRMQRRIPFLAAAAGRYVGEMEEIAATFDSAGVSGDFYRGAAWLYQVLAASSLALETRADLPAERSLDAALAEFQAVLESER
jgi:3-hydroxyisobutyrate dehydrogenase-like beta-hydroxyacid dehydrogenase